MQTRHRFIATATGAVLAVAALGVATPASAYYIDSPQLAVIPAPDSAAPALTAPWTATRLQAGLPSSPAPTTATVSPDGRGALVTHDGRGSLATPDGRGALAVPNGRGSLAVRHTHAAPDRRVPRLTAATRTGTGTWWVAAGETLTSGTTVERLVRLNADRHPSLATNPDLILAGWHLVVPAS